MNRLQSIRCAWKEGIYHFEVSFGPVQLSEHLLAVCSIYQRRHLPLVDLLLVVEREVSDGLNIDSTKYNSVQFLMNSTNKEGVRDWNRAGEAADPRANCSGIYIWQPNKAATATLLTLLAIL
eukprot:gene6024-biopygen13468